MITCIHSLENAGAEGHVSSPVKPARNLVLLIELHHPRLRDRKRTVDTVACTGACEGGLLPHPIPIQLSKVLVQSAFHADCVHHLTGLVLEGKCASRERHRPWRFHLAKRVVPESRVNASILGCYASRCTMANPTLEFYLVQDNSRHRSRRDRNEHIAQGPWC